jgi:choline dehydrogenase
MSDPAWDFVVVGGGAAGSVLANRLSADPARRVLLLEAGRPDFWWDPVIRMPAAMGMAMNSRALNWNYVSEPEPHMRGRRMVHPRGRVLGGSSSINAMTYVRGNRVNFDRWAALSGSPSWDYAHCLPYFRRAEDSAIHSPYHGMGGPQGLDVAPADNPLFDRFFRAARQAGYPLTDDFNGAQQEGFGRFERFIRDGRRVSASRAYLHPVRGRANLEVRCRATTTRILFSGGRAAGVVYHDGNGHQHVATAGEVIVAGGTFNSPQLLQLSGIGDREHLSGLGIETIADLPAVGRNVEDHLAVHVQHACLKPLSVAAMKSKVRWPLMGAQWLFGRGPATSNIFEAAGFIRSNDDVAFPDVIVGFAPMAMAFDPDRLLAGHGYQCHVSTMAARARGSVLISSADPGRHPRIVLNYLDNDRDRADWVKAIRIARDLLSQPAFADVDGGEILPGPDVQTDEEIVDWVSRLAQTGLHPTGSCRMGPSPESDVVDPDTLQVHGVSGLRVVDASVFPSVTNTQTYAAVLMVAEKAADMILGHTPLAPEYPAGAPTAAPEVHAAPTR